MSRLKRLQRLVQLREARDSQALAAVSEHRQLHQSALDLADQLAQYREQNLAHRPTGQDPALQRNRVQFLHNLDLALSQQSNQVDARQQGLTDALQQWQQARAARDSMAALTQREQTRLQEEQGRREERWLSELMSLHAVRNSNSGTAIAKPGHEDDTDTD